MRIDMNKTMRKILAWILIITMNTLLFLGSENYAWAEGILPNASGSIDSPHRSEISIETDASNIYKGIQDSADVIKQSMGEEIAEEEPKDIKDEAISKAASDLLDNSYDKFIENLSKAGEESAAYAASQAQELANKSAESTANAAFEKIVKNNADGYAKYADEAAEYMKEAGDMASKAEVWKYAENVSKALQVLSNVADVASLISDYKALTNLNGENTATRVIEGVAITADMAVIIVGLCCPGVNIPIAASIAVGLFAQFIHNKKVTDWLDEKFDNLEEWWDELLDDLMDKLLDELLDWIKLAIGINCYKPNIYIYPEEAMDVAVQFKAPQSLIKMIPDYTGIWDVHVDVDGRIYTEEGYAYDYLFYECETNPNLFETEEGFLIHAESRLEQFEDILNKYGFNQQEISDFTEFWCMKLEEGKDYVMYPQMTELVDNAMEIDISPKPDTCVRMWFVFEEYAGNMTVETPQIEKIEREGYTVIEWGGMIK